MMQNYKNNVLIVYPSCGEPKYFGIEMSIKSISTITATLH